jgi:hypothetical protein
MALKKKRMRNKSMTHTVDVKAQKAMQDALSKYKKDKNSVKEFYPCTQELSQWLQTKEKKCK